MTLEFRYTRIVSKAESCCEIWMLDAHRPCKTPLFTEVAMGLVLHDLDSLRCHEEHGRCCEIDRLKGGCYVVDYPAAVCQIPLADLKVAQSTGVFWQCVRDRG